MSELRAYRVSKGEDLVGFLGEGPGPFILASYSPSGYPLLRRARFTCVDAFHEDAVGSILEREHDFGATVAELERAGFGLEPARYEDVFQPANDVPLAGPEAIEDVERLIFDAPERSKR